MTQDTLMIEDLSSATATKKDYILMYVDDVARLTETRASKARLCYCDDCEYCDTIYNSLEEIIDDNESFCHDASETRVFTNTHIVFIVDHIDLTETQALAIANVRSYLNRSLDTMSRCLIDRHARVSDIHLYC